MERKIGEIFECKGEWYQCVEGTGCYQCAFNQDADTCLADNPHCTSRSDRKDVVFKRLEKVGEPITVKGRTFQRLNVISCLGCVFRLNSGVCDKDHYIDGPCINNEIWAEIKQNKEDTMEETKLNIKPFSLEAAKAGKPVCTRDGRKARIICFDRITSDDYSKIVACITSYDGKDEYALTYGIDEYITNSQHPQADDLMMLSEKKEGWVNVYYDNDAPSHREASWVYDKEEEAIKVGKEHGSCYIATVRIEWEE